MKVFSPTDLGRWEREYRLLLEGERLSLTPTTTWMLGDKPGIVAVFDQDEVVYIAAAQSVAKTLQSFHRSGAVNEFRTYVAIFECGLSPKTAEKRYKNGRSAERVDAAIGKMAYSVVPGPTQHLDQLAKAFATIADPRYNGPTALGNLAIDALPK